MSRYATAWLLRSLPKVCNLADGAVLLRGVTLQQHVVRILRPGCRISKVSAAVVEPYRSAGAFHPLPRNTPVNFNLWYTKLLTKSPCTMFLSWRWHRPPHSSTDVSRIISCEHERERRGHPVHQLRSS